VSLRESALRVATLRALADKVKEASDRAREAMRAELEETGAEKSTAYLPDGTKAATVSYVAGKRTARVTDERALLAWVRKNRPQELEGQIRPAYLSVLLDSAAKRGVCVDEATGEVIPGVEAANGQPFVSCRFDSGGRDAIAAAWQAGELDAVVSRGELTT